MSDALSQPGLGTLHDLLVRHVDAGRLPGLVALVAKGDDVHVDTIGTLAFTDSTPMARDSIFRIASMTKPITAVTAMSLVEEGVITLDQPIDDLVPELANRRVLRAIDVELDDTVPARRAITVEDLLSFRMGFGLVMAEPGSVPIQRAEDAAVLRSIGRPPWPPVPHDVDSWIAALGALPLMYQPGERWMYNTGAQVLGVVIARATGSDLPTVMRERVFEPLGMHDTGFSVPSGKLERFTTFYVPDDDTGGMTVIDDPATSWWSTPPTFPDGSGMLVSTLDDYWSFASMMRARGAGRDGTRVLKAETVDLMTTDRLTSPQRATTDAFLAPHAGWGLGMEAPATDAAPDAPPPCGFGWDGGSGTTWRSNRTLDVTGILLTQRAMTSPQPPEVFDDFWRGVNAAALG
ncbi:MAG TPA: serine hydrolase domain-containing protein [Acidimicrobiia bacterium]|nr:serine hydrolase domain-containing protein [Acidimicrobiia bacterium]